jgi:hypothetical protein
MSEPTSRRAHIALLGWRAAVIVLLLWNVLETRSLREVAEGAQESASAALQAVGLLREDLDEALSGDGPVDDSSDAPAPSTPGAAARPDRPDAGAQAV